MLNSFYKKPSKKNIKKFLIQGKLNPEIPSSLLEGLVYYVYLFLNEGFSLTQITEVSSIGQIVKNEALLKKIKDELLTETFRGGYITKKFEIHEDYVDFLQFTLDNGESYAVAYNSPGDYMGTYSGILWLLKLEKRLEIGELPDTHFDFRRS